jgi:hypothetical protein
MGNSRERLNFRDETGQEWTVFETGEDGNRSLVFESDEAFRRIRRYPSGWRDLSADALLALSWMR